MANTDNWLQDSPCFCDVGWFSRDNRPGLKSWFSSMLNMKIWEHPLSSANHSFSSLSREDHDAKCPEDIHVNKANKARCEGCSFQLHPLAMSTLTKILSLLSWIWEWWVWEQPGPRYISLRVMMKQGLREKDKFFYWLWTKGVLKTDRI